MFPRRAQGWGCGLRLDTEALQGRSPQLAQKSYFRSQPKSATANYAAKRGEGAGSARFPTPERPRSRNGLLILLLLLLAACLGRTVQGTGRLGMQQPRRAPQVAVPQARPWESRVPAACAPWRGDAVAEPGWQCRLASLPFQRWPPGSPGRRFLPTFPGREKPAMGSAARRLRLDPRPLPTGSHPRAPAPCAPSPGSCSGGAGRDPSRSGPR